MRHEARDLTTSGSLSAKAEPLYRQQIARMVYLLAHDPTMGFAAFVLLLITFMAVFAPFLSPYDPITQDTPNRLQGISSLHFLGTDHFGRDIFTRLMYGSRTILLVGFVSIAFAVTTGTFLGMVAAYVGGTVETLIMRSIDVLLSFPLILLSIVIVVILGPGILNLILAIGISQVPLFTRLARSLTLSICACDYIQAAYSIGASGSRILSHHVLPNIITTLFVQATTTLGLAILNASALNFLGLGIQPPSPDWGAMVSDFRRFVFDRPYLPLYPGAAITVLVLTLNLIADGLVKTIDPTASKNRA